MAVVQSRAAMQSIDAQIVGSFAMLRFAWSCCRRTEEDLVIATESGSVHLQTRSFPTIPNRQSRSAYFG
jgi:hypothetical protein